MGDGEEGSSCCIDDYAQINDYGNDIDHHSADNSAVFIFAYLLNVIKPLRKEFLPCGKNAFKS